MFAKAVYLEDATPGEHVFRWIRSHEGWETAVLMLDGILVDARPGFQFLTNNLADDAQIELSFGPPHNF